MIELLNVTKTYDAGEISEVTAVNDVNLKIGNAGLVCLFGPSGCGKTTLLNLIGGLDAPTKGKVLVDGKSVDDAFRLSHVGCVFQDFVLMDSLTVADNVRLLDPSITDARINETLSSLGILGLRERKASKLSGGEKQRVCIARAIIGNPSFIIADEPTGNLDGENRVAIMRILKSISKRTLVLLVSHEKDLVEEYADRIIRIEDGSIVSDSNSDFAANTAFSIGKCVDTKVPLRRTKRKKSNIVAGILSCIAIIASCFIAGFGSGKAEATNRYPETVYRMTKPMGAEDRAVLSPYAFFRSSPSVGGLSLGDSETTEHGFVGGPVVLPFDFYGSGTSWEYDEDSIILTSGAAKTLIEKSYSSLRNSYRNLMLSQYGINKADDLIGLRFKTGHTIRAILPGEENVGYISPRSFYRLGATISVGNDETKEYYAFNYFSSRAFVHLAGIDLGEDKIYAPKDHPVAKREFMEIGGRNYKVEVSPSLQGFEELVLPSYAASAIAGDSITWAYAWDNDTFSKLIRSYENVDSENLHEAEARRINQTKAIFGSIVGGVGLAAFALMSYFYAVDLQAYFKDNKNEYVVYRSLGVNRSRLFKRALLGVFSGALPLMAIGSVSGVLIVAFLGRSDVASLYLTLHIGTFFIGVSLAALLVLSLCAVLLWKRFLPSAAEFKRINQQTEL